MVKYIVLLFLIFSVNLLAAVEPLVDPTKPLYYKSKLVNKNRHPVLPKLQSILIKGKQRQAIINNKLYITGQKVNGYQIRQINNELVLLSHRSKLYTLTLYPTKELFIK